MEKHKVGDIELPKTQTYEQLEEEQKSQISQVFRVFIPEILFIFAIQNLCALMSLYQAFQIHETMQFLESDDRVQKVGIALIIEVLILRLALTLAKNLIAYYQQITSFEIAKQLIQQIGVKLLKSPQKWSDQSSSNMVNLISTDAQQIVLHFALFCESFGIPLQIILSLYFLFVLIGYTFILGLLLMLLTLVANSLIGRTMSQHQIQIMSLQDKRVRRSKEIFSKINLVKSYVLEGLCLQKLLTMKSLELKAIHDFFLVQALQCFVLWLSPQLITLAALLGKVYAGEQLSLSYTFTIICLIQTLQIPLQLLTSVVGSGVQLHTSFTRIGVYFGQYEMSELQHNTDQQIDQVLTNETQQKSIEIKNATFYLNNETEVLININLNIAKGQFISIIGPIGSGKTSLLLGILGELGTSQETTMTITGRIAYVSQNPWLLNASIRENILMGQQFDEQKYLAAVEMSFLSQDLLIMSEQDNTMAGEGGKNISGGQRTRVSLARALYSDADIYLFDDILSALDAQVANQIFNNCFINHLNNKTRVLVTHSVDYCKFTDYIIILENGYITNKSKTSLVQLDYNQENQQQQQVDYQLYQPINQEVLQEQSQQSTSLLNGMKILFDIGIIANLQLLVYTIFLVLLYVFGAIWLSIWSHEQPKKQVDDKLQFMLVFLLLSFGQALMAYFRNNTAADMSVELGQKVHNKLISSLLHAHINNFFNKVPIGRIINRLSIDMISVDTKIIPSYYSLLTKVGQLIANCAFYILSSNVFLTGVLALYVGFCSKLQVGFLSTSNQLQTQEKKAQGHLVSLFSELLSGLPIIRAYGAQNYIKNEITSRVDLNKSFYKSQAYLQLKLKCVLSSTSLLINSLTLAYIMFFSTEYLLAGIVLTYAFRLDMNITMVVELLSQLQNNFISLDRCLEYTSTPPEDSILVKDSKEVEITEGSIRFVNVSLRYSENAPNALSNVNLEIEPGMKVGIIGRTGAGKSSMMQCLLRSVDITQGEIWLDSYELSSLPLSQLRKIITLIAQDPIMMEGTLRENLDPFNKYSDQFINEVIESCGLKQIVESKGGLETKISVNADEFSKGEKQLLSIARAVLKNTKIILIDEATSNLNAEADLKIQETIKEVFKNRTVITIAHRLNTVLCCDKIAIMEQGQVMEFNTPTELMKDKEQYLYQMLQQQDKKDM